jgi:hypothetical protein
MHTAKTQSVRQPQRNRFLLRPSAYYRHYGPAAWIDPVVLSAITIPWNNIVIPVRSCPHGHPGERPFLWFTNDFGLLRVRCGTKRAQVTQNQSRSQSYDHYPHALASLPHTQPRPNSDLRQRSLSRRCPGHSRHQARPDPRDALLWQIDLQLFTDSFSAVWASLS